MLRLANTICEKTNDATQAFVLYKDMMVPGILERFPDLSFLFLRLFRYFLFNIFQ